MVTGADEAIEIDDEDEVDTDLVADSSTESQLQNVVRFLPGTVQSPLSNTLHSNDIYVASQNRVPFVSAGTPMLKWNHFQRNEVLRQECVRLNKQHHSIAQKNQEMDMEILKLQSEVQRLRMVALLEKQSYAVISDDDLRRLALATQRSFKEATKEKKRLHDGLATLVSDNSNLNLLLQSNLQELGETKKQLKALHHMVASLPEHHIEFQGCRAEGEFLADDDVDEEMEVDDMPDMLIPDDMALYNMADSSSDDEEEDDPAHHPVVFQFGDAGEDFIINNIAEGEVQYHVDGMGLEIEQGQLFPVLTTLVQETDMNGSSSESSNNDQLISEEDDPTEDIPSDPVSPEVIETHHGSDNPEESEVQVQRTVSGENSIDISKSSSVESGAEISRDKACQNKEIITYFAVKSNYLDSNGELYIRPIVENILEVPSGPSAAVGISQMSTIEVPIFDANKENFSEIIISNVEHVEVKRECQSLDDLNNRPSSSAVSCISDYLVFQISDSKFTEGNSSELSDEDIASSKSIIDEKEAVDGDFCTKCFCRCS